MIKSAKATDNSIKLEWNAVSGADSYRIDRRASNQDDYKSVENNCKSLSFTDKNLKPGQKYYYRVYAKNSAGTSPRSDTYQTHTKPATPKKPSINRDSSSQLTISWDKVSGADEYKIYRRKYDKDKYEEIGTSKSTSYTDKKLSAGTQYFYRIAAVIKDEEGSEGNRKKVTIKSDESETKSHFTTGARPENNVDNDKPTNVILDWEKVKPKTKESFTYEIKRNGKTIKTGIKGTSYTDTTATPGVVYKYEIKTEGASWSTGEFYAGSKITKEIRLEPQNTTSMKISWDKPSGAPNGTQYTLFKYNNSSKKYDVHKENITSTSFTDTNLKAGETYQYYVQVRDSAGNYLTSTFGKSAKLD